MGPVLDRQRLVSAVSAADSHPWACQLHCGDLVNWAAITAIGTVLAGLALPLAFIQLGGLRQDRLRGQVSKVGAWTGTPEQMDEKPVGCPDPGHPPRRDGDPR
jgi:hypothetical protein